MNKVDEIILDTAYYLMFNKIDAEIKLLFLKSYIDQLNPIIDSHKKSNRLLSILDELKNKNT